MIISEVQEDLKNLHVDIRYKQDQGGKFRGALK